MDATRKAAVFLDRDGTIIEDRGHLRDVSDIVFFADTFEALRRLAEHFLLFIVTNQPGIAYGQISRDDAVAVNDAVVATLRERGITITEVYMCEHERRDDCRCIKPKPYFLDEAAKTYGLDLTNSFVVGDHGHDIELAHNAGAQGIYVLTGHGRKHLAELPEGAETMAGIGEAAEWILSHRST